MLPFHWSATTLGHVRTAVARCADPNLPEMHASRAWLYLNHDLNWAAAEAEIEQGLRMDPENYHVQIDAGQLACVLGRWDEAMRYSRAAISLDPFNPVAIESSGSCSLRCSPLEGRRSRCLQRATSRGRLHAGFARVNPGTSCAPPALKTGGPRAAFSSVGRGAAIRASASARRTPCRARRAPGSCHRARRTLVPRHMR
jgi:tetratricopeptide (TPR) repeat protein